MRRSVIWRILYGVLKGGDGIIGLFLLNLNLPAKNQSIRVIGIVFQNRVVQRNSFAQFARQNKKLNVSLLDGQIVRMTGDQGRKFRKSLLRLVASDVEVTEHSVAGGHVGHLRS